MSLRSAASSGAVAVGKITSTGGTFARSGEGDMISASTWSWPLPVAGAAAAEAAMAPALRGMSCAGVGAETGLPQMPVFVDARTDLYDDKFLQEYFQVMFIRPGWQAVLDRRGVRLALTERDSFLATMLATQPEWRLAYGDDQAVIWVREKAK
jgi:hypothetical protein